MRLMRHCILLLALLAQGLYAAPSAGTFGQASAAFSSDDSFPIGGVDDADGVVVVVFQANTSTPETISVTVDNGGTPVSVPAVSGFPVGAVNFSASGGGAFHLFFRDSGVPTGALVANVTKSGSNTSFASGYKIQTASGAPEVNATDVGIDSAAIANPRGTISLGGGESLVSLARTTLQTLPI